MRQSRVTDEQIIAMLHVQDAGAEMVDRVRPHGVTEQTPFRCKKRKYGGMQAS